MLMCREHWFRLPRHMRKAVLDEYARAGGTDGPIKDLSHEPYWRACANAVEFICKTEGRPLENAYRKTARLLAGKRDVEAAERRIQARRVKRVPATSFAVGERVRHSFFGLGTVLEVTGEATLRIKFDGGEVREISMLFKSRVTSAVDEDGEEAEIRPERRRLVLKKSRAP